MTKLTNDTPPRDEITKRSKLSNVWKILKRPATSQPMRTKKMENTIFNLPVKSLRDPKNFSLEGVKPTSGVAAVRRRISGLPLKPLVDLSGKPSPRPANDIHGETEPSSAVEPPYKVTSSDHNEGFSVEVSNGFDKLSHSIDLAIGNLPDPSLDSRMIRLGKWLDRYQKDQQPQQVLTILQPLLSSTINDTRSLPEPNLPSIAVGCSILHQCILLLITMYPQFEFVGVTSFNILVNAIFLRNYTAADHKTVFVLHTDPEKTDELMREELLFYSEKTYFQSLRDVSKRLGQAMTTFEKQSKEREKLCKALNRIIAAWQCLYKGTLFRGWRNVRRQRLQQEDLDKQMKKLQSENKSYEMRQKRVNELADEVRREKGLENQVLREGVKKTEEANAVLKTDNDRLNREIKTLQGTMHELQQQLSDAESARKKLKRECDQRYSSLAKTAFHLSDELRWPEYEINRLEESNWKTFYGQFMSDGNKIFSKLSESGDPSDLISWFNALASQHPSFSKYKCSTIEYFEGSSHVCFMWACLCSIISPGQITRQEVDTVYNSLTLTIKGGKVLDMLRLLGIPDIITAQELTEDSMSKHHMLAIIVHYRFVNGSLAVLKTCGSSPFWDENSIKAEPQEVIHDWPAATKAHNMIPYQSEDGSQIFEVPDDVAEYLNMPPSALERYFKTCLGRVRKYESLSQSCLFHSLTNYCSSERFREQYGTSLTKQELQDRPKFVNILYQNIKTVATETEIPQLQEVLQSHYRHLRKIFSYYGAADVKSINPDMSYDEMWKFVNDCGIPQKGIFDRTNFRVLFANADSEESGKNSLSPSEFVHALVHIANARCKHREDSITGQLSLLLDRFVIPEASFSDVGPFKKSLSDPLVRRMLERRQNDMLKVFKYYSSLEMTDATSTMSVKEFLKFMTDTKVTDEVCTHHALQQIFLKLQDDDQDTSSATELQFHEFVACICAVAAFKNPAPYLPLHIRVQRFWQSWVLPPLKKQLKLTDGAVSDAPREDLSESGKAVSE